MKIIEVNGNKYVDQALFDYINNIWLNYNQKVADNSTIMFAKNTTINRLITDYNNTGISRCIKKEKADYLVLDRITISNYPQFFDGVSITDDDTKEVVYGLYNNSLEDFDTVELILDFYNRQQPIKFVNQDVLNESLNNGFILDKESYILIKELVDTGVEDNCRLAYTMIEKSDLKSNWQWLLYIYHKKHAALLNHDKKSIIRNYFSTLSLPYPLLECLTKTDVLLKVITDKDVKDRIIYLIKDKFNKEFATFMEHTIGTKSFDLQDFKLKLKDGI